MLTPLPTGWINHHGRQLVAVADAVYAEVQDGGKVCSARAAGYICTRAFGHPGRHIATAKPTDRVRVIAAFPGDLPPDVTDLEEA